MHINVQFNELNTFKFHLEHFWTFFYLHLKKKEKTQTYQIFSSEYYLKWTKYWNIHLTVSLTLLFAFKIRDWISDNNGFMKIFCDVMTFLFSEIATWILIYVHLDKKVIDDGYFKTFNAYVDIFTLLMPVLNTLIHSVLIYNSIRGVSKTVSFFLNCTELCIYEKYIILFHLIDVL